jgi:N-acetylglucosamine kinase-like BadF-type ATPase
MKYVIGIDSGGTKYRVLAWTLNGKELGGFIGPPCSHYHLEQGEMLRRIAANIDACLAIFRGRREDCAFLVCGATGLDSEEDRAFLNEVYGGLEGFQCPRECINDGELALYTVTGGYGALVISGTGSIAVGRNKKGETARTGGWLSSIMGDEGSGTWVSKRALRQLGRWFDGVVPDGLMFQFIRDALQIRTRKDLMDCSARIAHESWETPKLGPLVDQAALQGDQEAQGVMKAAAWETFTILRDLVFRLRLDEEGEFPVGIWGSNILKSPLHQGEFGRLVGEHYPQALIRFPSRSAAEGAAQLALSKLSG